MSSITPRSVTRILFTALLFLCAPSFAPAQPIPLISSQTPGPPRNNISGWFGTQFFVGENYLTVRQLGRMCLAGNSGSHVLALNSTNQVTVSMAGCTPGSYVYAPLPSAVQLSPLTYNTLLSLETAGGDTWSDWGYVTSNYAAAITALAYSVSNLNAIVIYPANGYAFGPVNLFYDSPVVSGPTVVITSPLAGAAYSGSLNVVANAQAAPGRTVAGIAYSVSSSDLTGSPTFTPPLDLTKLATGNYSISATVTDSQGSVGYSTPVPFLVRNHQPTNFVTGGNPGTAHNTVSGWFGMRFTTSAKPLAVTRLGRMCEPGNSGLHTLVMTPAMTPGSGAVTAYVSMEGCTPGTFVYGYTRPGRILAPQTQMSLFSQETAGGDNWADWGTVSTTADAAVNGLLSNFGLDYAHNSNFFASPGYSYGLVDFTYGGDVPAGPGPTAKITSPSNSPTVSGPLNVTANVSAGSAPIAFTRYFVDGAKVTLPINTASLPNGLHTIQVFVGDTQGLTGLDSQQFTSVNGATSYLVTGPPNSMTRNDITGWFGMQFTTGQRSISITDLGRACVSSAQASTHELTLAMKLSGGSMLYLPAGASVTVNVPAFCTSPFVYGHLANAAHLSPNQTYVLLSKETAGSAPWYDWAAVAPRASAAGDGILITGLAWAIGDNIPSFPVMTGDYQYTNYWILNSVLSPNYSFVGLDIGYVVNQAP